MGNRRKYFSSSIDNEKLAARIYDRFTIENLGLRAKTNLTYRRTDLLQIIQEIDLALNEPDSHLFDAEPPETLSITSKISKKQLESDD